MLGGTLVVGLALGDWLLARMQASIESPETPSVTAGIRPSTRSESTAPEAGSVEDPEHVARRQETSSSSRSDDVGLRPVLRLDDWSDLRRWARDSAASQVVILPAAPPDARADAHDVERHQRPLGENGGYDFEFSFARAALPLDHVWFTGSGVPSGTIASVPWSARGDQVGLHSPAFLTGELAAHYTRRFLSIGLVGGYGSSTRGTQRPPMDQELANSFGGGSMRMLEVAGDVSGVLPLRPVTLRIGVLLGARYVSANLGGLYHAPSGSRCSRNAFSCPPNATATLGIVEPRVSVDYAPARSASKVALGAFVGMDAIPEQAWTVGVSVSWRVPHWELAR
jgi:hypothetical protein